MLPSTGVYQADALPRRPFLGLEIGAPPGGILGTAPGLYVVDVTKNGAAARAGILAGDLLIQVNDEAPRDVAELMARSRTLAAGAPVRFVVTRSGEQLALAERLDPLPLEQLDGADVVLDHIEVDGHRLRVIYTVPHGSGPRPAVLYLQGIACTSCEYPFEPDRPVFWPDRGLDAGRLRDSSARAERRGRQRGASLLADRLRLGAAMLSRCALALEVAGIRRSATHLSFRLQRGRHVPIAGSRREPGRYRSFRYIGEPVVRLHRVHDTPTARALGLHR